MISRLLTIIKNIIFTNNKCKEKDILEKFIDKNIYYFIEGIDLFHVQLHPFFEKCNFISRYFTILYVFLNKKYPKSWITLWFIKNTKLGSFRIISHSGKMLVVRNFLVFKNVLIYLNSYYLNIDNITSEYMSKLSVLITQTTNMRQRGFFSERHLPASVMFDAMAILPLDPNDIMDLRKWTMECDWVFFPKKKYIFKSFLKKCGFACL